MQFREGAQVVTADGDKVGTIDRVVLQPDTKEVTHLVVRKGFLFSEDKVVPVSLVGPVIDEQIMLREDAGDLSDLPDFEESQYVAVDPAIQGEPSQERVVPSVFWYPPVGTWWGTGALSGYAVPQYVVETRQNIPEGAVALQENAKVISSDGEHVGDVERVFTDAVEDRATHVLISRGLFRGEKKLIPTSWMSTVLEDEIHLSIPSDLVENLPEYETED